MTFAMAAGVGLAGLGVAPHAEAQPGPFPQWCPGEFWDPGWGDNWDGGNCHDNWHGGTAIAADTATAAGMATTVATATTATTVVRAITVVQMGPVGLATMAAVTTNRER